MCLELTEGLDVLTLELNDLSSPVTQFLHWQKKTWLIIQKERKFERQKPVFVGNLMWLLSFLTHSWMKWRRVLFSCLLSSWLSLFYFHSWAEDPSAAGSESFLPHTIQSNPNRASLTDITELDKCQTDNKHIVSKTACLDFSIITKAFQRVTSKMDL